MPIAAAAGSEDDDDEDDDFYADLDLDNADFGKFAWDPVAEPRSPPQTPPNYTPRPPPRGGPAASTSSRGSSSRYEGLQPPPLPPAENDLRAEARLLAAAAAAGLAAAARAVSRAVDLLLSFVRGPRPPGKGGRAALAAAQASSWGLETAAAVAVPPRPAGVARLMAAVVAGSLALLAAVLLCDEVGRRLVMETLVVAAKK